MKNFFLLLSLFFGLSQITKAQTACADFVAGTYTITQENSFFGPGDVYHFNCIDDILLHTSCSTGAPSYHMRVAEFDLNTWVWTKDFYGDWILVPVPSIISVSDFFPANEPTCGKIYAVQFVEGPTWNPADVLFFTIDCPSIPFEETYACKENLRNDSTSIDVAYDQLFLKDGTRVTTGYTKLGNQVSLFIEKMDAHGVLLDKMQYPIEGDFVSNVQITYDKPNNEFLLFFDTRVSNNHNVYLLNVNSTNLVPIQYHSKIVPETVSSHEYAVKIESHYNGEYILLVNQSDGIDRNAYSVYAQRISGNYAFSYNQININSSNKIYVYDVIETGGRIGNSGSCGNYDPSFLICGSVDNEAFLLGTGCFGSIYGKANVFDIDGNTNTTDPAKRIEYYNGKFYVAGETGTYSNFDTSISGKTWLGEFNVNHILAPTEYFSANYNWLSIYEKNSDRKESLIDLDLSDGNLYLAGQTGIEDIVFTAVNANGPKAYISKVDLNGNIIWSKAYYEQTNTETKIYDIELVCGSIQSVGKCNERIVNLDFPPSTNIINQFVYKNKLNLNGLFSKPSCYHDVAFTRFLVNPPVNERLSSSYGESLIPEQLSSGYDGLLCETECCSSIGEYCPSVILLNERPILPDIYHADVRIESAGRVATNTTVDFKAEDNISLKNDFSVEAGATFSAYIEECNECNICLPTIGTTVVEDDNGNLVITWDGAENADSLIFTFYNFQGNEITTVEHDNDPPLIISENEFPSPFTEIFELDVLVNCGFQIDCPKAFCERVDTTNYYAKDIWTDGIIIICDD